MWDCICSSQVVRAGAVHHTLLGATALCRALLPPPKSRAPYCLGVPNVAWEGNA